MDMKTFTFVIQSRLPLSLLIKATLIGTRFESSVSATRWHISSLSRYKHPELMELYLEERQLPFVAQRLLGQESNAVDVGAHIGSFLSLVAKQAPKGQHIAFEPSRGKSEWLKKRFPTVEVIASAVGDENGTAFFIEDLEKPGFSHLEFKRSVLSSRQKVRTRAYQVSVRRLDDVLLNRQINLIKLDIEGGELLALRGARRTIEQWQPSIIFECGPESQFQKTGGSRFAVFEFVTATLGYNIYTFSDFLFKKGSLNSDEFRKCGLYPFRAFNFVALPKSRDMATQTDDMTQTINARRRLDFRGA
jgi:FkbM family methyltransferase